MPLREHKYDIFEGSPFFAINDLYDAMNEWIADNEKIHADAYKMVGEAVGQITQRLDLLEDMMFRGGRSENIKPIISSPPKRKKKVKK